MKTDEDLRNVVLGGMYMGGMTLCAAFALDEWVVALPMPILVGAPVAGFLAGGFLGYYIGETFAELFDHWRRW